MTGIIPLFLMGAGAYIVGYGIGIAVDGVPWNNEN